MGRRLASAAKDVESNGSADPAAAPLWVTAPRSGAPQSGQIELDVHVPTCRL